MKKSLKINKNKTHITNRKTLANPKEYSNLKSKVKCKVYVEVVDTVTVMVLVLIIRFRGRKLINSSLAEELVLSETKRLLSYTISKYKRVKWNKPEVLDDCDIFVKLVSY
jgi:hypothetical protein